MEPTPSINNPHITQLALPAHLCPTNSANLVTPILPVKEALFNLLIEQGIIDAKGNLLKTLKEEDFPVCSIDQTQYLYSLIDTVFPIRDCFFNPLIPLSLKEIIKIIQEIISGHTEVKHERDQLAGGGMVNVLRSDVEYFRRLLKLILSPETYQKHKRCIKKMALRLLPDVDVQIICKNAGLEVRAQIRFEFITRLTELVWKRNRHYFYSVVHQLYGIRDKLTDTELVSGLHEYMNLASQNIAGKRATVLLHSFAWRIIHATAFKKLSNRDFLIIALGEAEIIVTEDESHVLTTDRPKIPFHVDLRKREQFVKPSALDKASQEGLLHLALKIGFNAKNKNATPHCFLKMCTNMTWGIHFPDTKEEETNCLVFIEHVFKPYTYQMTYEGIDLLKKYQNNHLLYDPLEGICTVMHLCLLLEKYDKQTYIPFILSVWSDLLKFPPDKMTFPFFHELLTLLNYRFIPLLTLKEVLQRLAWMGMHSTVKNHTLNFDVIRNKQFGQDESWFIFYIQNQAMPYVLRVPILCEPSAAEPLLKEHAVCFTKLFDDFFSNRVWKKQEEYLICPSATKALLKSSAGQIRQLGVWFELIKALQTPTSLEQLAAIFPQGLGGPHSGAFLDAASQVFTCDSILHKAFLSFRTLFEKGNIPSSMYEQVWMNCLSEIAPPKYAIYNWVYCYNKHPLPGLNLGIILLNRNLYSALKVLYHIPLSAVQMDTICINVEAILEKEPLKEGEESLKVFPKFVEKFAPVLNKKFIEFLRNKGYLPKIETLKTIEDLKELPLDEKIAEAKKLLSKDISQEYLHFIDELLEEILQDSSSTVQQYWRLLAFKSLLPVPNFSKKHEIIRQCMEVCKVHCRTAPNFISLLHGFLGLLIKERTEATQDFLQNAYMLLSVLKEIHSVYDSLPKKTALLVSTLLPKLLSKGYEALALELLHSGRLRNLFFKPEVIGWSLQAYARLFKKTSLTELQELDLNELLIKLKTLGMDDVKALESDVEHLFLAVLSAKQLEKAWKILQQMPQARETLWIKFLELIEPEGKNCLVEEVWDSWTVNTSKKWDLNIEKGLAYELLLKALCRVKSPKLFTQLQLPIILWAYFKESRYINLGLNVLNTCIDLPELNEEHFEGLKLLRMLFDKEANFEAFDLKFMSFLIRCKSPSILLEAILFMQTIVQKPLSAELRLEWGLFVEKILKRLKTCSYDWRCKLFVQLQIVIEIMEKWEAPPLTSLQYIEHVAAIGHPVCFLHAANSLSQIIQKQQQLPSSHVVVEIIENLCSSDTIALLNKSTQVRGEWLTHSEFLLNHPLLKEKHLSLDQQKKCWKSWSKAKIKICQLQEQPQLVCTDLVQVLNDFSNNPLACIQDRESFKGIADVILIALSLEQFKAVQVLLRAFDLSFLKNEGKELIKKVGGYTHYQNSFKGIAEVENIRGMQFQPEVWKNEALSLSIVKGYSELIQRIIKAIRTEELKDKALIYACDLLFHLLTTYFKNVRIAEKHRQPEFARIIEELIYLITPSNDTLYTVHTRIAMPKFLSVLCSVGEFKQNAQTLLEYYMYCGTPLEIKDYLKHGSAKHMLPQVYLKVLQKFNQWPESLARDKAQLEVLVESMEVLFLCDADIFIKTWNTYRFLIIKYPYMILNESNVLKNLLRTNFSGILKFNKSKKSPKEDDPSRKIFKLIFDLLLEIHDKGPPPPDDAPPAIVYAMELLLKFREIAFLRYSEDFGKHITLLMHAAIETLKKSTKTLGIDQYMVDLVTSECIAKVEIDRQRRDIILMMWIDLLHSAGLNKYYKLVRV